jgi:salicylate hydroxylase
MPHQSQGACMAIEDAAALGILFNKQHFKGDIKESLAVYEKIRLPRATKVQASAAKAAYNINERIGKHNALVELVHIWLMFTFLGFSSNTSLSNYKVEDEANKLTIEEMNGYDMYKHIDEVFAERRQIPYNDKYTKGLPHDLKLPSGVAVH